MICFLQMATTTCLESAQLAFLVFGAIFGTLLLSLGFLFTLGFLATRRRWVKWDISGLERLNKFASPAKAKPAMTRMSDFRLPSIVASAAARVHPTANGASEVSKVDEESGTEKSTDRCAFIEIEAEKFLPANESIQMLSNFMDIAKYSLKKSDENCEEAVVDGVHSNFKGTPGLCIGDKIAGIEISLRGLTQVQLETILLNLSACKHRLKVIRNADTKMGKNLNGEIKTLERKSELSVVTNSDPSVPSERPSDVVPSLPSGSPPHSFDDGMSYAANNPKLCSPNSNSAPSPNEAPSVCDSNHRKSKAPPNEETSVEEKEDSLCPNNNVIDAKKNDYENAKNLSKDTNEMKCIELNGKSAILTPEQCGTLEMNRQRLENERQQLRRLGIM